MAKTTGNRPHSEEPTGFRLKSLKLIISRNIVFVYLVTPERVFQQTQPTQNQTMLMKLQNPLFKQTALGFAALGMLANPLAAESKEADLSKPVKVFIIMGQSNTLEMGKVEGADKDDTLEGAVKKDKMYPFLVDEGGAWTVRKDVRNVSVMVGKGVYRNDWLTISSKKMGIEIGIGHKIGDAVEEPVMILKSSIGNRGLGWDLLPPGSESWEHVNEKDGKTYVYAGYKQSPARWEKGTKAEPIGWYAGKQYDDDVANAKKVLSELDKHYPGAKSYEVAGFLWWQGDKDMRDPAYYNTYEKNLVNLIKALRKDFDAPKAPFVTASLGQTPESDTASGHGVIMQAMKNVASGKYSAELGDNISFVYTNPLSMGSSSSAHYGGNAKTYMNVGVAMGEAMTKLIKK